MEKKKFERSKPYVNIGEIGDTKNMNSKSAVLGDLFDKLYTEENKQPDLTTYNTYCSFINSDGKITKIFNSQNVYLLFDKQNFQVKDLLFKNDDISKDKVELYSLECEEALFIHGIPLNNTGEYYRNILENNYIIGLSEISNYVVDHIDKPYYTIEEINQLITYISAILKEQNNQKPKRK